jgi:hypothetical protein
MFASIIARTFTREPTVKAVAILLVSVVIGACAPSSTVRAYVAPTRETVFAKLEAASGPEEAGLIWVENRSTVPITVTSVTLHGCDNIRQACDQPNRMNAKLEPESRKMVMRVAKKTAAEGYTLSYTFAWAADSSSTVALSALAKAGSIDAAEHVAQIDHAKEIRRLDVGNVDEDLNPSDMVRLGEKAAALRAEPDSVVLERGTMLFVQQLRILVLGSQGEVLGRLRARSSFRVQPGAIRVALPDSLIAAAPGRSVVTITVHDPAGSPRATPFPPLHFTLIVK